MAEPTCVIEGCEKPTRSSGSEWCAMHYHRWYRHGATNKVATRSGITVSLGRRYRTVGAVGHPLVGANGRLYEHRFVLYNEIGPGPHACHWCGRDVDWLPKGDPDCLNVDHLNDDGADNRTENLVPCCVGCNTTRALQHRSIALREAGWWSSNDTIASLSRQGRAPRIDDGWHQEPA